MFVVSWVNPDERHAEKGFEAYMREGIFAALDAIEAATGERDVAAIGYCVGGTLLAITLAFMAEIGDKRISSATFFTTQVDFTDAGDLKVFVDAEQLKAIERKMAETGYLEGAHMANAFNMLRPNDLIWSYFVNNYLKGKEPMPFDLLVWNADSTRMPAANHRFYLRHCYLQNDLTKGRMTIEGKTHRPFQGDDPGLRAGDARRPYRAGADRSSPAPSSSAGRCATCSPAPAISPAWSIPPTSRNISIGPAGRRAARSTPGSTPPRRTPARGGSTGSHGSRRRRPNKSRRASPARGKLKPLCDAPGEYVRVRV